MCVELEKCRKCAPAARLTVSLLEVFVHSRHMLRLSSHSEPSQPTIHRQRHTFDSTNGLFGLMGEVGPWERESRESWRYMLSW